MDQSEAQLRRCLVDLCKIAADLNCPSDDDTDRARTEGYRDGIRFAVAFIEGSWPGDLAGPEMPLPRHE
jgi:hypothetical protein